MDHPRRRRAHRRYLSPWSPGRAARPRVGRSPGFRAGVADPGPAARAAVGHLPAGVRQRRALHRPRRPPRRHRRPAAGVARPCPLAPPRLRPARVAARKPALHLHAQLPPLPLRLLQGAEGQRRRSPRWRASAGTRATRTCAPSASTTCRPWPSPTTAAPTPTPGSASWASAFDVEAVTRRFFAEYRAVFEAVEAGVAGVPAGEPRRLYVQRLFNRLMFLYFIQRKGLALVPGGRELSARPVRRGTGCRGGLPQRTAVLDLLLRAEHGGGGFRRPLRREAEGAPRRSALPQRRAVRPRRRLRRARPGEDSQRRLRRRLRPV